MGFFSEDIAEAEEIAFDEIQPGTYPVEVVAAEIQENKAGTGHNLVIDYGFEDGRQKRQWIAVPSGRKSEWDDETVYTSASGKPTTEFKTKSFQAASLKAVLTGLGVPPESISTLDPEDLVGLGAVITVSKPRKVNPEYPDSTNISKVAQPKGGTVSLPTTGGAPEASSAPAPKVNPFA